MKNEIINIINYLSEETKITFDKPLLLKSECNTRTWYIHAISPDTSNQVLNIFYSDGNIEIKKVDFFNFHPDNYENLLDLIQNNI